MTLASPVNDGAAFSFAYQPIIDAQARCAFGYEALVRGPAGEPASFVLSRLQGNALHVFDRDARIAAIQLASRLGLQSLLSLNFMPGSLHSLPDAVDAMLDAAANAGMPVRQLLLEVTEGEIVHDVRDFADRVNAYRASGLRLAIDDFGAGYSGLNLLAEFQPDAIKLDLALVRGIDASGPRQAIVRAVIQVCDDLGIEVIAEGIETLAEFAWLRGRGVRLFQGHLFGRPTFESLAEPLWP
jgi:EAL domain-containing protein (putative c-di-GMP-specific phosphodiesterase class I)